MNKATLATKLSERLNVPRKIAEDFIHTFQDVVTETLADNEEVTIAGFGTFSSRIRAARKGVNPRNPNETIDVPAVKVPKFKAGKALKDSLKASMGRPAVKEQETGGEKQETVQENPTPKPTPAPAPQAPTTPAAPHTPPTDTPKPENPPIHM